MKNYSYIHAVLRLLVFTSMLSLGIHAQAQTRIELDTFSWFTSNNLPPGTYTKPGSPSETIVSNIPVGGGGDTFCTGLGGYGPNGQTIIAGSSGTGDKGFFESLNDYGGIHTITRTYAVTPGKLTYMKVRMANIPTSWLLPSSISASIDGRSLGTADRSNSNYRFGSYFEGSQSWIPTSNLVSFVISMTTPGGCHSDEEILYVDAFYQATTNINAADDTGASVSSNGGQSLANVLSNDSLNNATPTLATVNLTQISTTNPKVTLNPATGAVTAAPGTPGGTQQVVYQICEKANPGNCSQATVTVPVTLAPPTITIKKALAGGGRINAKDQFTVNLMFYRDSLVASGTTTGSGSMVDANSGTTNPVLAQSDIDYPIYYGMSEAMASGSVSALSAYTTTVACQNDGGGTTNVSGIHSLTNGFAVFDGDAIVCTITNSSPGATINVSKVLGGTGRVNANDQFKLEILNGSTLVTSVTTAGTSGTSITSGASTGDFTVPLGVQYTITEEAAGVGANLGQYSTTMACVNNGTGGTDVSKATALGAKITPVAGDVIRCTITNTPNAPTVPTVTVKKISRVGTGMFTFKGTSNANGFSTNGSYKVQTANPDESASGSPVTLTAAGVITEIQEVVPAGWTLTSASCVDTNAPVSGNPTNAFGLVFGNTLQIPLANVLAGADLQCTFTNTFIGLSVSGKVILDTGVGTGTGVAHDAKQNGSEPGQLGVVVSLTDCAVPGQTYSTTTSAGDGSFSLNLSGATAGQPVCIVQSVPPGYRAVSADVGNTPSASYNTATTTLKFTPGSATAYSGVVLGNVPMSTFVSDGAQQVPAGQLAAYAHTYVAGTAGSVTFSTADNPAPAALGWSSTLYVDRNCDGVLDGLDTLLTAPMNVIAGQQVCLLNRVMTPAGAANGAQDTTTVSANESWTITSPAGGQSHTLKNTDITTVGSSGLTLHKEVRRILSGVCPPDATTTTTAFASSGTASPGDWLEYRLRYGNNTAAPLTAIVIRDSVPAYTRFGNAQCLSTPTVGLSGCVVTQPDAGVTSGSVAWTLTDATTGVIGLQPTAFGTVSFCIQIEPKQ
jgi:hypothetical protein